MTITKIKFPVIGLTLMLGGVALAWGQSTAHDHMADGDHSMNMHDHMDSMDHNMDGMDHGDHSMHDMPGMSAEEHAAHLAAMKNTVHTRYLDYWRLPDQAHYHAANGRTCLTKRRL